MPVRQLQLAQHAAHVGLDGLDRDEQLAGDLLVGAALGHQAAVDRQGNAGDVGGVAGGEKGHRINNGYLKFLGDEYRRDNNLEKPKKVGPAWGGRIAGGEPKGCRDWFSKKYYSSVMKLNEHEASFYGDRYNGLMASALTEIFRGIGAARNL